jgi:hypothetical protein
MFAMLKRISTALAVAGAVTAGTTSALAQAPGQPNPNQATADSVASVLSRTPSLVGYRIGVEARGGLVILSGGVSTPEQHRDAMNVARTVPGVTAVQDMLKVAPDALVRPARYQMPGPGAPTQLAMRPGGLFGGGMMGGGTVVDGGYAGGGVVNGGYVNGIDSSAPMPEGAALSPAAAANPQPGMPNYAWPSYAPYPNFSAVGYPTAYPWQAWPNIGPFYPYPEVPLDWRAVTLRWDDGIWWLDFKKHYTRPFITPYLFGLFAY